MNTYLIYLNIISINLEGDIFFKIFREDYNIFLINILNLDISKYLMILEFILREFIALELFYLIIIVLGIFIIEDLLIILSLFNIILLTLLLKFFKIDDEIFKYKLKFFNKITIFFKDLVIFKIFIKII